MRKSKSLLSSLCISAVFLTTIHNVQAVSLNQTQAKQYAMDAYIYDYPLVTMQIT